ncbi:MAG: glycosyltransferase family 39 protein, partial [Candidatus Latescibacteria bacterium]|nr:glycosyltransferase family 39 protein [Candidatus Latescibacterota bacterium]
VAAGEVAEQAVVVVMRLVCVAAGLGCLWLVYRIGSEAFARSTGLVAAALIVINPVFLRWAVEIHPDLPQLFWVLLSLLWCTRLCRCFSLPGAVLASLCAGLALATKYSGVFLLPLIAGALLFAPGDGRPVLRGVGGRIRDRRRLLALVLVPVVFAAVFLATNPYAWVHYETFLSDVAFERDHLGFGHVFRADRAGLDWLVRLAELVGIANGVVLALYVCVIIWLHLSGRRRLAGERILLLIWIGGFTGYLILTANLQAPRHLLPVLPPALLFLAEGYREVWRLAESRWPRAPWLPIVFSLVLAGLSWGRVSDSVRMFGDKRGREGQNPEIAVGRWIGKAFSDTMSVIYDAYAYVPGRFERAYRTFGQTYPVVNHFRPDLLVVREAIASRFADPDDAQRAQMGAEAFLDRHYFYRYLEDGRIPTYDVVRDSGRVAVYRRRAPETKHPRKAPGWITKMRMFASGKLYGQAEARVTMGDIHASLERWPEAEQEYRAAGEVAPDHPAPAYKLARSHLMLGREGEAARGFERVLSLSESAPSARRGAVCHNIALNYSARDRRREAVRWAREALKHDPASRSALFDLGAFLLALGDETAADSAYAAAVRRHGPDEQAAERLREMVRRGDVGEPGRQILVAHFGEGSGR